MPNASFPRPRPRPVSWFAVSGRSRFPTGRVLVSALAAAAPGIAQLTPDPTINTNLVIEVTRPPGGLRATVSDWDAGRAAGTTDTAALERMSMGTSMLGESSPRPRALAGPGPSQAGPSSPSGSPLQWGGVTLHPHVAYTMLYGTGLLSGPGREENTFLNTLAPGLGLSLGPRWYVDYTPSLRFYSSPAYQDTVDQAVYLSGQVDWAAWQFKLAYSFLSTSDPLVETASQTAQDTHQLDLGANRNLGEKTSLQLGFNQALRFTENYTDSLSWSTTDWLDYEFNRRLGVALGLSAGYDDMDPGTDMTSERVLGRIRGTLGTRFTYSLSGGLEWRQFLDTGAPARVSPTVDGSLAYRVFETTDLNVHFAHELDTSYYADQYTESTRFGGGLRQRLLRYLYLSLNGEYSTANYLSPSGGSVSQREDDNLSVQVALSTVLLKRLQVSVFYRHAEDQSDRAGYSFDSNQLGLSLSLGL